MLKRFLSFHIIWCIFCELWWHNIKGLSVITPVELQFYKCSNKFLIHWAQKTSLKGGTNVLDDPFFQEPDQITIFCHKTEPDPITIFLPAKWARSDHDLDQIIPDHFWNYDLPLLITIFPQNWPSLPFLLHFYALIFYKDWKIGRIF